MSFGIMFFCLLSLVVAVLGIILAFHNFRSVLSQPESDDKMSHISKLIRDGSQAYLNAQFKTISPFILVFAAFIFLLFLINHPVSVAVEAAGGYVLGALLSLACGYLGMKAATISNVRVAGFASQNRPDLALHYGFLGGSVMGLLVGSFGLLGLVVLYLFFGKIENHEALIGFGFGASSISLFARVGGGIYTKAADVGADLVGKVESNIPEDDPRNPGVIADNVGDNVGDVAGMGADIFESFVAIIIGCLALGATLDPVLVSQITNYDVNSSESELVFHKTWLMFLPILQGTLGLIGSMFAIKFFEIFQDFDPAVSLRRAVAWTLLIYVAVSFPIYLITPVDLQLWVCSVLGALAGVFVGLSTDYYTSKKPIFSIVEASKTGPATNIIAGFAVGLKSTAMPIMILALITLCAIWIGGIYGSALAGVGMLAGVAIVMTIDAFGPIADNAGGIVEMSGQGEQARNITDRLDAVGNTTAALGKGFAIGASALTAVSLFYAYVETVKSKVGDSIDFSITNENFLVGVLIGSVIPAIIAALTMEAVGKAAGKIVEEIRRQFREIPGLLRGDPDAKPEIERCISISTHSALSQMKLPGLIAVVSPFLIRFVLGLDGLGGYVLGVIAVGIILGISMANSGGAWDNAKKAIEQGLVEGEKKGTETHKATVVGDTVGDPFKDTSGPALNILIKIVSVVSLLIASMG
ncbi:MAG: sodium-translocating pyrophosphatase [Deltaproteobacteria bacterium]|nr:sodium-translocating pyrophosphatase [Deltaproteobacteria bacterium]